MVMQVNQVHSEFVNPMKGSHDLPLAYIGLMTCCFSSSKLKKHWPFLGLSTKDSCHSWRMLLHSFFPAKQVRFFARKGRDAFACFDLVINKLMSRPLSFAWAIPAMDFISAIFS